MAIYGFPIAPACFSMVAASPMTAYEARFGHVVLPYSLSFDDQTAEEFHQPFPCSSLVTISLRELRDAYLAHQSSLGMAADTS